jgi:hypothetical protein
VKCSREKESMTSKIIGTVKKEEVVCVIDISNKVEYLNNKKINYPHQRWGYE